MCNNMGHFMKLRLSGTSFAVHPRELCNIQVQLNLGNSPPPENPETQKILKPLSLSAFVAEKRSVLATSNKQPATRISYTTYFSYIEPGNVTEKAEL